MQRHFCLVRCRCGKEKGLRAEGRISIVLQHLTWSLPRGYHRTGAGRFQTFESDFPEFSFISTPITPMSQPLWLRCEKKEFERRAALSPKIAKSLIDAGFSIHVERDEQRIFDDSEYESYAHLC